MSSETYYVPESSKLPLLATIGLITTVFGASHWLNDSSVLGIGGFEIFMVGALIFAGVLASWWNTVIKENMAGLPNAQLKRSYVWGMGWFIFSEVMFFFIFFFALAYVRIYGLDWLEADTLSQWGEFTADWPLMTTPDQALNGEGATEFIGPNAIIDPWHLPLYNTIILLASSFTVHIAHNAIKAGKRGAFNLWLGITIALGATFLYFQVVEYHEAYTDLGLTLQSGIYGTTFFMLTGFHGAHVTMGTIMLLIQLCRSVFGGHFKKDDHFGFEASSWYWHFVDVVWVCLFIFVYVL
ncbi:cytochrome c oxidase subunit 3 [Porticoccaceae bacterium LTM1]|nr:cytochrome c oxidase subunit 3 [Porticoccaceae bacterium LTM1]